MGVLPCLWATPTDVSAVRSDRTPRHPADKAVELAAEELAALGEAVTGGDVEPEVNPLTGEPNRLIHPRRRPESAAAEEKEAEEEEEE